MWIQEPHQPPGRARAYRTPDVLLSRFPSARVLPLNLLAIVR